MGSKLGASRTKPVRRCVFGGIVLWVSTGVAAAQGTGQPNPPVLKFRTLSEALDSILLPRQQFDFANTLNGLPCDLDVALSDLTEFADPNANGFPESPTFVAGSGAIGPNLSRHCDTLPQNVNGGAILSGGLASPQSSRTVSTFTTRRPRRTAAEERDDETERTGFAPVDPIANLFGDRSAAGVADGDPVINHVGSLSIADSLPAGELQIFGDKLSLFGRFEYDRIDREPTEFENAARARNYRSTVGVAYLVTPSVAVGVAGQYGFSDGDLFGNRTISLVDVNDELQTFDYEVACGVPSDGEFEADRYGGSLFAAATIGRGGFVSAEIGASKLDQSYSQSRCLFSEGVGPEGEFTFSELFAGTIQGEPGGFNISGELLGGVDFPVGRFILGPRAGLSIDHTRLGSYAESELATAATSPFLDPEAGTTIPPTGSALVYDQQDFTSVQARVGGIAALPFFVGSTVVTPFGEATYVHEFANDQRDIVVHFVEDFRANPTVFSFKNNEPDRDYFELGGGLNLLVMGIGQANLNAKAIVGNSLFDGYSVNATLRVAF